jgi:hypothetical protein
MVAAVPVAGLRVPTRNIALCQVADSAFRLAAEFSSRAGGPCAALPARELAI